MNSESGIFLQQVVARLAILTIGLGVGICLLLWARRRGELWKQAWRLQLSSYLVPPIDAQAVRLLLSKSRTTQREILEEILLDQCRLARLEGPRRVWEELLVATGLHEKWIRDLGSRRSSSRLRAALKLGYVRDQRVFDALVSASSDGNIQVQMAVCLSLARLADPRGLPGLLRLARQGSAAIPALTLAAGLAACARGEPRRLLSLLRAPESRTRIIGAWALSETAGRSVLHELVTASRDPEPEVRAKVARALARVEGAESLPALLQLAGDPVWFVRVRAFDALGQKGEPAAEPAVMTGLEDPKPEVRYRAAYALRRIRGMQDSVLVKVLADGSPRSFRSLISEWDRAGFLSDLAAGLSTRDWPRFVQCRNSLKTLIAAGVTRPLVHFVLVFPDIKVRLRLLRLLLAHLDPQLGGELQVLPDRQGCDPRVARAIKNASALPALSLPPPSV
jgi:HEAT repeat protein